MTPWPRRPDGTAKPVAAFTDAELEALLRAHLPRRPVILPPSPARGEPQACQSHSGERRAPSRSPGEGVFLSSIPGRA